MTLFPFLFAAKATLPYLLLEHRVILGACSPEFITGKYIPDVNQKEGNPKNEEDHAKNVQEFHNSNIITQRTP